MAKSIEHNIFPDLSPRAELFEKTGLIEKIWLDKSSMGFPEHLVSLLQELRFFSIKGVPARFDEEKQQLKVFDIPPGLLSSLYNQNFPMIYLIHCRNGNVSISVGTNASGEEPLSALLETTIGPALYERQGGKSVWDPDSQSYCAAITGIPNDPQRPITKERFEPMASELGIERLVSGLMSHEWTYMVQAFPIRREQTNIWLEGCAREIKDTKESFLLRDIQKSNRMATYYVEILEKTIRRLKFGKQQGLWQAGVYLFSDDSTVVSMGAAILLSIFSGDKSSPEPVRSHLCNKSGAIPGFINCYHSKELQLFVSLPRREFPGFRLHEEPVFDVDFVPGQANTIPIGRITAGSRLLDQHVSVPVDDLTRHGLVAGVTGSGKTNTLFNLLTSLYSNFRIPFLVIEPAKAEYRSLLTDIDSLLVFTIGHERPGVSCPFRLNPFAFPEGVSLQTHIDYLKAVFDASFVMYAPMPYVLEDCLYRIYEDKGWNLVTATNFRGKCDTSFPTLSDLYRKIDEVVEDIGYQDRTTMDIKSALKTRIKNLCLGGKGMMLNSGSSVPFNEIMTRPTVLELKYLGNDEEKAFMMGLILTAVWEHYEASQGHGTVSSGKLRHLTVIEEAHRLLKNVPTEKTSEEMSNIKGKGVETFCNLLAEIRAYGEGVFVSEQIPTKLAPDVIKNTNLKIMHRIVAKEDREVMGETMSLDKGQQRHVASLETGTAIVFREGLDRPLKVNIPLSGPVQSENQTSDTALSKKMAADFYEKHRNLLTRFAACAACPNKGAGECERTKHGIEDLAARTDWEALGVKAFLPYLLEPERTGFGEHLGTLINFNESSYYCLAAHMVSDYLEARGNYLEWPFERTEALIEEAQGNIETKEFQRLIGVRSREYDEQDKGKFAVCEPYCRRKCLFSYEASVLARDPVTHNHLVDLLGSREYGTRFYQELIIIIMEFFRGFMPSNQAKLLRGPALCYLVQKLNELGFSPGMQQRILGEFIKGLDR